ncbi:Beta-1,3-glucan phosphorylase, family GH149 [Tenacibaculum litopenaei]
MNNNQYIYSIDNMQKAIQKEVKGIRVLLKNEGYYKIANVNLMRPFFMSIVSPSNHWLFISSTGGLTAGRQNAEFALFPYDTDDKIAANFENTGSKTLVRVEVDGKIRLWEPFSDRMVGAYATVRNLYKNETGTKVLFEEINNDVGLAFRYEWTCSERFGFVRSCELINLSEYDKQVEILDGVQNVLPFGVGNDLQRASSNLVDAYKRSELMAATGIGVFALSAIIVDRAEPSEALKANVVWSVGMKQGLHLLSSLQLESFRTGYPLVQEMDVKAEKGAYFVYERLVLTAGTAKEWCIVADVNLDHAQIVGLNHLVLTSDNLQEMLHDDIAKTRDALTVLNASADGLQCTQDELRDTRHFANTLFNCMRGGIFDFNYSIETDDFKTYIAKANKKVAFTQESLLNSLATTITLKELRTLAWASTDKNFRRLCLEYLPIRFSRRHGDPSRPWNKFSINTKREDGSKKLDYEGNWRDIFQNWEALAFSFPDFLEGMIHKFLNASTFDGYNPYRVTKDGFDWETIEPEDPWSYIGYWGDHQIVYLLKLLEAQEKYFPGELEKLFEEEVFVYANVPYKIKEYQTVLNNPKDSIVFDVLADKQIRASRTEHGADGALLRSEINFIVKANFIEKILATTLAKISNFIPDAGIWMNTQRPEWNDANNALVGNGVSVVTLAYLHRFVVFVSKIIKQWNGTEIPISEEFVTYFETVNRGLLHFHPVLTSGFDDIKRKQFLDAMGNAVTAFRTVIYDRSFSGRKSKITKVTVVEFFDLIADYTKHSLRNNRRNDGLFHSYNLMTLTQNDAVKIERLDEMLEGQVAALSAGVLSAKESLALVKILKVSRLYRKDQNSYLLYPNKYLKGFMQRNCIPTSKVEGSKVLAALVQDNSTGIIQKDLYGQYHFNGSIKNADDLQHMLKAKQEKVASEAMAEVLSVYELVFQHKFFTGRSGTFFGYEGLGSIYWHMVSKLALAVQEVAEYSVLQDGRSETSEDLLTAYDDIVEGIGVHKSPKLYGAFPTDPYSHTPANKGAQQPGMTGQVKEDILTRFGEFGIRIHEGVLHFDSKRVTKSAFLTAPKKFQCYNVLGEAITVLLEPKSFAFTLCQLPIIYQLDSEKAIELYYTDGRNVTIGTLHLNKELSKEVFGRTNVLKMIVVKLPINL